MRRIFLSVLTVVLAGVAALVIAGLGDAAPSATSIVGHWTGRLGSHAPGQRFSIVVNRGERAGTWRINSSCAGTLRLKDISDGYHHYYRVEGANRGCAPLGVDCLKRAGARMVDVFVPNAGPESTGTFRRVS